MHFWFFCIFQCIEPGHKGKLVFSTLRFVQPVTVEVIQAKINLIKQLDSIPAAHQFVEDFQIETVNQLDSLMKMEAVIGVKPTTEQLNGINNKIDAIINELETGLKNKMLAKLNGLGLGALSGLIR